MCKRGDAGAGQCRVQSTAQKLGAERAPVLESKFRADA